jgi:hypothetical protein
MSDYIDENFEIDETDEFEGVIKHVCEDFSPFIPNRNDIKEKSIINFELRNNAELKAKYKYVDN